MNGRLPLDISPRIVSCLGLAATLSVMATSPVPAQSQQAVTLVQELCAMCHATGHTGGSPHAGAPPFRRLDSIYDLVKLQEELERGTILPSHPDMPLFKMDRRTAIG